MQWNDHSRLARANAHALLSPSKATWITYDNDRLIKYWENQERIKQGTKWHKLAEDCINMRQRLPDVIQTIPMFVNDALRYKMRAEQMLFYSEYVFGTADAISFYNDTLRIHDLKTGVAPGKTLQLDIYAAIFCLEYSVKPNDIRIILRIYQDDEYVEWEPEPEHIFNCMDSIINKDTLLRQLDNEE